MIAIAFPGQGAQKVGMTDQLSSEQQEHFKQASDILGYDLLKLCQIGPQDKLSLTQFAQPSLLVTSISRWSSVADSHDVSYFLGHSLGQITALVVSGAISFKDGVKIVAKRGELMGSCNIPGGMAAIIGLDQDQVQAICDHSDTGGKLTPANFNSPRQIVISGDESALEYGEKQAIAAGARRVIHLPVSGPFHSNLMSPASEEFAEYLSAFTFKQPQKPVISNIDSRLITSAKEVKQELVGQLTKPVRWIDNVLKLEALGVTELHEVGPGNTLVGLTKRITKNISLYSI